MKISVITCVYNGERFGNQYIRATKQILDLVESVIIIDDGSSDEPEHYLADLLTDPKVRMHKKTNSGLPDSRNVGVNLCTSEYVIFLDIDDAVNRKALQTLVNMENPRKEIIRCFCKYTTPENKFNLFLFIKKWLKVVFDPKASLLYKKIHYNNYLTTPGTLVISRDLLLRQPFHNSLTIGEDWEFFTRIIKKDNVCTKKLFLQNYLVADNSMSYSLTKDASQVAKLEDQLVDSYRLKFPNLDSDKYRAYLKLHNELVKYQRHASSMPVKVLVKDYFEFTKKYGVRQNITISFFKSCISRLS